MGSLTLSPLLPLTKITNTSFCDNHQQITSRSNNDHRLFYSKSYPRRSKTSHAIVPLQGWYNKLQRDEVVAEWKKVKGKMSLHVHCHISGGHFLLDLFCRVRYFIFCKELPVVLKAFVHGDEDLLENYPELLEATVWVHFHSNVPEFDKVQCWGPLREATAFDSVSGGDVAEEAIPASRCLHQCLCCFPPVDGEDDEGGGVHKDTAVVGSS